MELHPFLYALLWALLVFVGIIVTIAAWVAALQLYDDYRKRWRRIHDSPRSRFYQPKGRL